jgi:hypothetical protein
LKLDFGRKVLTQIKFYPFTMDKTSSKKLFYCNGHNCLI